jgi:hypothetical protein
MFYLVKGRVVSWTERQHYRLEIRVRNRASDNTVKNSVLDFFVPPRAPRRGRSFSAPRDPGAPAPLPTLLQIGASRASGPMEWQQGRGAPYWGLH